MRIMTSRLLTAFCAQLVFSERRYLKTEARNRMRQLLGVWGFFFVSFIVILRRRTRIQYIYPPTFILSVQKITNSKSSISFCFLFNTL